MLGFLQIIGKEIFLEKLYQNRYKGLEPIEEEYTMKELYSRMEELQQEMKCLVSRGVKAGMAKEKEHLSLKTNTG